MIVLELPKTFRQPALGPPGGGRSIGACSLHSFASGCAVRLIGNGSAAAPSWHLLPRPRLRAPPSSAVQLEPNSAIQAAVNAYPTGSAFLLTTGLYDGFTVIPKQAIASSRNRVSSWTVATGSPAPSGAPGRIGERSPDRRCQHQESARHSALRDQITLTDRRRADQLANGQRAGLYGSGWRLQWLEVTKNLARGVSLSNQMLVDECQISSNGRLGVGGRRHAASRWPTTPSTTTASACRTEAGRPAGSKRSRTTC